MAKYIVLLLVLAMAGLPQSVSAPNNKVDVRVNQPRLTRTIQVAYNPTMGTLPNTAVPICWVLKPVRFTVGSASIVRKFERVVVNDDGSITEWTQEHMHSLPRCEVQP